MSYNNEGGSGWNMPFCVPFMQSGNGGGMNIVTILAVVFFGLLLLMASGGLGGLFGGGGGGAAAAADLVGQRAVAEKVSSIATGVDATAGLASANGVKIETAKDLTVAGFAGVQRDLCSAFSNAANLANSNHYDLTRQNTDLRFQISQCCCDQKAMAAETQRQMADLGCRLSHQVESGNSAILRAIADLGCSLERKMDNQRMAELEAKNAKLENMLSQHGQTAQLAALIQQQTQRPSCGCNSCCPPSVCDLLQTALANNWINKTLTPATAAATTP